MKPWEKPCVSGSQSMDMVSGQATHYSQCHICHGTGVVPMTTAEMLEALPNGAQLWKRENTWASWSPDGYIRDGYQTPDDALRAALEAVERTD